MPRVAFCVFIFSVITCLARAQANYSYTIYVSPGTYAKTKSAVDDLQHYLGQSAGKNFTILKKDDSGNGIQLVLFPPDTTAKEAERIREKGFDAALLKSDGKGQLFIGAITKAGLINGIYTYLDRLGCRWYLPGDIWAIIPTLKDVGMKADEVVSPDFELRTFSGTYGTPRNAVIDKGKNAENEWNMWAQRNRMVSTYVLKGHAWNDFLWRNLAALKSNPDYMAQRDGKRVEPKTAAKFCISNSGFRQLFVQDMVQQLQLQMKRNPDAVAYFISVEPSDGNGACQCDKCEAIGNNSDRVFLLANEVAKAFQKVSAKAYVNLYAYNDHAFPPKEDLQKNIVVQLIPYKYQSYAKPEVMLEQWKNKFSSLFIYDYYGLPLANVDMPLQNGQSITAYAQRIKNWYKDGIRGYTLESSYSIGATGMGLYLAARLGWNHDENVETDLEGYYTACFGKAGKQIKEMQEALGEGPGDATERLNKAVQLLHQAQLQAADNKEVRERMATYMVYLHYLHLLYDFEAAAGNQKNTAADALMNFVYSTFFRLAVHNYPISEKLKSSAAAKFIQSNWDSMKPSAPGMKFSKVKQLSTEEIEALFNADYAQIPK